MDWKSVAAQAFATVPDCVAMTARSSPHRASIVVGDEVLDYAALDLMAHRVAAALQRDGLLARDSVAICTTASAEYLGVFIGALRAGMAVAPLAPSTRPQDLVGMLRDSGARVLFADEEVLKKLGPHLSDTDTPVVALDDCRLAPGFATWLSPASARATPVQVDPASAFNIIYSSGTTGDPKGIVQSHAMRWGHIQRAAPNYGGDAITLIATPLYSNTTLASVFPTIALGGTIVLLPKFSADPYLKLAQKHRVSHTMLVPVQYQRIMASPHFEDFDLSAFQMKYCTSAPFSAALKRDILNRWPGGLVELYGMTEGGGTCVLAAHEFPNKLHTVGRPAPGHDIRVLDDAGEELPPGATGEVVGRSTTMMTGYHNNPARTAEVEWFDESGNRFIRTGDIGRFDEDGFLILMDRKKDIIISGGFNVYPKDIETVFRSHPDVKDVAVVGVPSEKWGETPVAFAVCANQALRSEDLLAWANGQLGKTQRVSQVSLVDELPRSQIGKVLKRDLRQQFIETQRQA